MQGLTTASSHGILIKVGPPPQKSTIPQVTEIGIPIYVIDFRHAVMAEYGPPSFGIEPFYGTQVTGAFIYQDQLYFASFGLGADTVQDLGSCFWNIHNPPGTECSAGPIDIKLLEAHPIFAVIVIGPRAPADLQIIEQQLKANVDPGVFPTLWFDGYAPRPPTIVSDPTQLDITIGTNQVVTNFP